MLFLAFSCVFTRVLDTNLLVSKTGEKLKNARTNGKKRRKYEKNGSETHILIRPLQSLNARRSFSGKALCHEPYVESYLVLFLLPNYIPVYANIMQ